MKASTETKAIAAALNIKHSPNISEATLMDKIKAQPKSAQEAAFSHPSQVHAEPPKLNTPEEILNAIKPFGDKQGFNATFDEETWTFEYKGRNESGHLSVPLRRIRVAAEGVSKGPLLPPMDRDANGKFLWGAR